MMRSLLLSRSVSRILSCTRGPCLLTARTPPSLQRHSLTGYPAIQQGLRGSPIPKITPLVRCSDLATDKYTVIYKLPYINHLRAVSRLKLLQTGITAVILPPVYVLYFQGSVPFSLVGYTTGIALFAGVMLYALSHFFRRVVGMMYLDSSQTTLKVSHLSFWGKRRDIFLPVLDVMTIADTGDAPNETILKLKRYSSTDTLYFSTYFGRVVDRHKFEKVFGS
ncbi:unnamed protein product [Ophioblennius macclurei]